MNIAIVCDDLTQHGGNEKVVLEFCEMFPEAPLYTTMATKAWQEICDKRGIKLKTSFMQKLPFKKSLNRFYTPLFLHMLALEKFDFDAFDLVISVSSRYAHGILTKPQTTHVCYLNTVGRMYWEPNTYFEHDTFSHSKILNFMKMTFLSLPLAYTRMWDSVASTRPDHIISNSKTTQGRVRKYYRRDSEIIHPPVEIEKLTDASELIPEKYFLVVTRLATWKKVDIAIEACHQAGVNLKILGGGPDFVRLKKLAEDTNTQLLGPLNDKEKMKYFKNCTALINTQFEDFGIVPLEANAFGKPVIAYKKGGVLETQIPGETGEFFEEQTALSLAQVLKNFQPEKYDAEKCKINAVKFDSRQFKAKIKNLLIVYTGGTF